MKLSCKQLFPVVLGTGLWLLGNMMLTPAPAKGSDPETQSNPGCRSENKEFVGHQECGKPVNGTCPGNWVDGNYTISECNGADLPATQYCDATNPGPGIVWLDIRQGKCNFFQGFCVQGDTTSTIHSFISNQPQCSNATGITP